MENLTTNAFQKKYSGITSFEIDFVHEYKDHISYETLELFGQIFNLSDLGFSPNRYKDVGEFIIENFKKEGKTFLKKLNGEFTMIFVISRQLLIFRDRCGAGQTIYFNNEFLTDNLIHFKTHYKSTIKLDEESISLFFKFGYIPSPKTIFLNVNKMAGGELLTIKEHGYAIEQLYSFEEFSSRQNTQHLTISDAVQHYEQLHTKAIEKRIRDNENIALLLSGGLDSGGNLYKISQLKTGVDSFSIGFKDNPLSEIPRAKLLAKHFDSAFNSYDITGAEIGELSRFVEFLFEPFFEGGLLLNLCAMKQISKHNYDLIIGGDGNDQLFGTGPNELGYFTVLKKFKLNWLSSFLYIYDQKSAREKYSFFYKIRFYNRKIFNVHLNDIFGFTNKEIQAITGKEAKPEAFFNDKKGKNLENLVEVFLSKSYFREIQQVCNEVIINKAKLAGSLYGNKISFPYLDLDLYNFIISLPREFRMNGSLRDLVSNKGKTKYLFSRYLTNYLPETIIKKTKQGGFVPLTIFLMYKDNLSRIKQTILNCTYFANNNYIANFLKEVSTESFKQESWFWFKQSNALKIFYLYTFAIWYNLYEKS